MSLETARLGRARRLKSIRAERGVNDSVIASSDQLIELQEGPHFLWRLLQISAAVFITCEDVFRVQLHVHFILLPDVSHDPFGAAVLLGGEQPTQWLRENPVKKMEGEWRGCPR